MTDPITPLESPQLEHEIRTRVEALYRRALQVLEESVPTGKRARIASAYASELRGRHGDEDAAQGTAREIVEYLVDRADLETPDFWRTALGQAVAWHLGYPEEVVPAPIAAAILGMSRQAVHDAKQRGTLAAARVDGIPQAGVSRDSVRAYLRAQHGVRA